MQNNDSTAVAWDFIIRIAPLLPKDDEAIQAVWDDFVSGLRAVKRAKGPAGAAPWDDCTPDDPDALLAQIKAEPEVVATGPHSAIVTERLGNGRVRVTCEDFYWTPEGK